MFFNLKISSSTNKLIYHIIIIIVIIVLDTDKSDGILLLGIQSLVTSLHIPELRTVSLEGFKSFAKYLNKYMKPYSSDIWKGLIQLYHQNEFVTFLQNDSNLCDCYYFCLLRYASLIENQEYRHQVILSILSDFLTLLCTEYQHLCAHRNKYDFNIISIQHQKYIYYQQQLKGILSGLSSFLKNRKSFLDENMASTYNICWSEYCKTLIQLLFYCAMPVSADEKLRKSQKLQMIKLANLCCYNLISILEIQLSVDTIKMVFLHLNSLLQHPNLNPDCLNDIFSLVKIVIREAIQYSELSSSIVHITTSSFDIIIQQIVQNDISTNTMDTQQSCLKILRQILTLGPYYILVPLKDGDLSGTIWIKYLQYSLQLFRRFSSTIYHENFSQLSVFTRIWEDIFLNLNSINTSIEFTTVLNQYSIPLLQIITLPFVTQLSSVFSARFTTCLASFIIYIRKIGQYDSCMVLVVQQITQQIEEDSNLKLNKFLECLDQFRNYSVLKSCLCKFMKLS
jgi:hypothetical protein